MDSTQPPIAPTTGGEAARGVEPTTQFRLATRLRMCADISAVRKSRSPGRLNFLRWRLIFLDPQYGTCIVAPKILRRLLHFWITYGLLTYTSVTLCAFVEHRGTALFTSLCCRLVASSPARRFTYFDAPFLKSRLFYFP